MPNEFRASFVSDKTFSGTGVTINVFDGFMDSPVTIFRSKKMPAIASGL